jgi:hypothetical protein
MWAVIERGVTIWTMAGFEEYADLRGKAESATRAKRSEGASMSG